MSKLLKLKEWVSLDQAANHLSNILEEAVAVADLYQLALNKQITLSVNLVNHADAKIGKVLPYSQIPKVEMPALGGNGAVLITSGIQLNETEIVNPDGSPVDTEAPFIHFEEKICTIDGIWDLAMIGAEVIDIKFWLNQKINAPTVELINLDGTFVKKGGIYASLQSRFENQFEINDVGEKIALCPKQKGFFPAGGLPENSMLVIRTEELQRFINSFSNNEKIEKPLLDRERTTFLNIIGSLLAILKYKNMSDIDIYNFLEEKGYTEYPGVSISTLQKKFVEAKRSIDFES